MPNIFDLKGSIATNYSKYKVIQKAKLKLATAPTLSIVSTQEAKNYLKVNDDTEDNDLITHLIKSSQGIIEKELGNIALTPQTWIQYQTGGVETIELLVSPIIGIPTVSYFQDFNTVTASDITYSTSFRNIDNDLYHADGYWEKGRDGDGYTITFVAGKYTNSNYLTSNEAELQTFKIAILRTIAWLYEQREEHVTDIKEGNWSVSYDGNLPVGIKRLLMPYHSGRGLI
jgi:hypothetical protein